MIQYALKTKFYVNLGLTEKINLIKDKYECLINSDILIICTEWGEYSEIDYKKLTSKIIFDGRNILILRN